MLLRVDDEERARGVLSGISFVTGVGTNEGHDALDLEVADISDERLIAINRTLVEARRRGGRDLARERDASSSASSISRPTASRAT